MKDLYQYAHYNCLIGKQYSCDLAKMEPNTKLFILHDGTTYANYGPKMFCCKTGTSGLEEPQETPQITLFSSDVAILACAQFRIANEKTKQNTWWEEAI